MLDKREPPQDGRRGASLVEMTLVFFLLLIILVGVIDFARAFHSYIVITNASREGARYGSRHSDSVSGIRDATRLEAASGGVLLEDSDIIIDPDPDDNPANVGQPITVTVGYDVDTILGHIAGFSTIPVRADTQMVVFWTDETDE